ncbi:MAG: TIGR00282 family metallophosphoesterase [Candidatus Omnitrophica bacterium]|nr:TIGR00282 family metallophosphoesterase [Candidatus Omnitrophota bacterium]
MNILCIGDIVGRPGREHFEKVIKPLREELSVDAVVVNGENASGGAGIIPRVADQLFAGGADVITLGDHTWDRREIYAYLNDHPRILRPANFPEGSPGKGSCVVKSSNGIKFAVINLLGRVFMRYNVACPFKMFDDLASSVKNETPISVVDIHAETTSEKVAFGHYSVGRASIVFGTHTHIQTADEQILDGKTAYITDLGMSGPYDSVIGQNKANIIQRFLTAMPQKFEVAKENVSLSGILVSVDEQSGKAKSIVRVKR